MAQCVLTLVGLALGGMLAGCFWGRMEMREGEAQVLCAEVFSWVPQGEEGVEMSLGSGTVLGCHTLFYEVSFM